MKKLFVFVVALVMAVAMVGCQTPVQNSTPPAETSAAPVENKVLNIYCWNTEFQDRFNAFYADKIPADVTVNWVITPSDGGAYQTKLDETLLNQESAAANDKIDLFLIEADYALKYVNSPYTMDVYGGVGLTEADTADMYQYTKDICTDSTGVLKGVSWQGCPGALIYRRSIAKDVLGTDDPAAVQEALSDWTKYDAVAAQAKAKGYYMTSGYVADYRVYSNNTTAPWVNASDEIIFDPAIKQWIAHTKTFLDNEYTLPYGIWDAESFNQAKIDGKAMCYFGPGWFFDFCLMPATLAEAEGAQEPGNGSYGDWAICKGPQGFFWGGTWICAAAGSDDVELVKDIMKTLTCDKDTLVAITRKYNDFTNNQKAMDEIAKDATYGSKFLGGQNHIAVLAQSAASISMKNISPYDQLLNEPLPASFLDYFLGNITEEQAYDNFYNSALVTYPNLKRPATN